MAKLPRPIATTDTDSAIVQLSYVVQRAAGDHIVDTSALLEDLHTIGVFVPDDDSEEAAWAREAVAAQPSHNELATGFLKLAEAPNPTRS